MSFYVIFSNYTIMITKIGFNKDIEGVWKALPLLTSSQAQELLTREKWGKNVNQYLWEAIMLKEIIEKGT